MQISSRTLQRVKFYFDIICPNTLASLKLIQSSSHGLDLDFRPICDFKLELKRNKDDFEEKKATGEIARHVRPQKLIKDQVKEVPDHLAEFLPADWQETHPTLRDNGCILAQLFLTSIKEHYPDFLESAVMKVGSRAWNERLPIHRGCYLSTCAREIGMPLRDSEFVVSRLSHRDYRKKLTDVSNEAVALGATQSPFFVVERDLDEPAVFRDVRDLFSCDFKNRMNAYIYIYIPNCFLLSLGDSRLTWI